MSPSFWQILIVGVIVLVVFGPKRIPEIGKSLGKAINGFKKGITSDDEIDVTNTAEKSKDQIKNKDKDKDKDKA